MGKLLKTKKKHGDICRWKSWGIFQRNISWFSNEIFGKASGEIPAKNSERIPLEIPVKNVEKKICEKLMKKFLRKIPEKFLEEFKR